MKGMTKKTQFEYGHHDLRHKIISRCLLTVLTESKLCKQICHDCSRSYMNDSKTNEC